MMINFPNYNFGETQKPAAKKTEPDYSNLILLGLGLLGGYLLFSKDEEKEKESKPLDNMDKAVANKIEIHGNPNILVGGKGDHLKPSDVSQKEFKKGLKVEREHTRNKDIASEIALDHLAEDPEYYTHLESIHKENPEHPFMNCRMFVQMVTGVGKIEALPKVDKSFKGAILWWGDVKKHLSGGGYRHVAIDNGDGTCTQVEEWGSPVSTVRISDIEKEYGPVDIVFDPRNFKKENPIKDPEGGLTAEGRKHFGGNLQPGVMKVETLEDLKRWGSWARRFYGRSVLPPMKDHNGEPTRIALDAQAWGCKIPKNKKEAKVIARRGSEALKLYKELKKKGTKKNDSVSFRICN